MKPHKHAELIKAWADGAEIEVWLPDEDKWYLTTYPYWDSWKSYRIKPEEKKPVVRWLWAFEHDGRWMLRSNIMTESEAMCCGFEKSKIKRLDWSLTEFEE